MHRGVDEALKLYKEARECDYITPRIKKQYLQSLKEVVAETKTPLVSWDVPRDSDEGRSCNGYFCDYCHPIEKSNKIIANSIMKIMSTYKVDNAKVPLGFKLLDLAEKILSKTSVIKYPKDNNNNQPSDTNYTLY